MLTKETIEVLNQFNQTGVFEKNKAGTGSYNYILVMEQDGEERLFPRFSQPCYGEMRIYNPKGWKPGDLHHPFPDGKPVGVAIRMTSYHTSRPAFDYTFSDESLWAPIFKDRIIYSEPASSKESHVKFSGFILTDMNFNSDYWFSLLLSLRQATGTESRWLQFVKKGIDTHTAWVAAMLTNGGGSELFLSSPYAYSIQTPYSLKNLLNRTPLDFYEGKLFSDRATFRDQPDNMTSRIWGGQENLYSLKKAGRVKFDHFIEKYIPYIESFR